MRVVERLRGAPGRDDAVHAPCASCDGEASEVRADAAALDVHVLAKRFGARRVLHDVRVRVAAGELVCLVGASGCGKSTLLRIAAGLDTDFEGSVHVEGRRHGVPTRSVGVVFQEPRLFPWCTVADNIAFEGGGASPDDAHVAALLGEVGLSGHANALPRQLSGGQAQRVALARALAGRPRVLLLDEPFSAVDAFTRMKLQDLLAGLVRRKGIAALMVTHDIDEAAYLGDRVIVLDADPGRVREEIVVPRADARERDDPAVAAARTRTFHALRDAHAF
jgi:sulfonate transport system ATP-binding protein